MAAAKKNLVAVTSFACTVGKRDYVIRQGDLVPADHPLVKGREELFEPAGEGAGREKIEG
jgi:hypothetical protein